MNDRNYDIRLVEKTLKIDKMFEDFLKNKLGKREEANATQGNQRAEERQNAIGVQQGYDIREEATGAD